MKTENTVIIRVDGMMCPHCEASVKGALEALDFVSSAQADHNTGEVTLTLCGGFDFDAAKAAVEGKGYAYIGADQ